MLSKTAKFSEKTGQNVFFLAYHVDYWNRGGWKDPFSKNQFTRIQNTYSSVLKGDLYTPQMIVNGETEFVGSRSEEATTAIASALKSPATIKLTIAQDSISADSIYIHYTSSETDKNYSLRIVITENQLVSKIGKGENSGKTLTHQGVVRIFYSVDLNKKNGVISIPLNGFHLNNECNLVAFAQQKQTMKILGAAGTKINFSLKQ